MRRLWIRLENVFKNPSKHIRICLLKESCQRHIHMLLVLEEKNMFVLSVSGTINLTSNLIGISCKQSCRNVEQETLKRLKDVIVSLNFKTQQQSSSMNEIRHWAQQLSHHVGFSYPHPYS